MPTPASSWTPTCPGRRCGRSSGCWGLVRRYGPGPVDTACQRTLDLEVVNVTKIASMLEKATKKTPPPPRPAAAARVRPRPGRIPAGAADADHRRGGDRLTTVTRAPAAGSGLIPARPLAAQAHALRAAATLIEHAGITGLELIVDTGLITIQVPGGVAGPAARTATVARLVATAGMPSFLSFPEPPGLGILRSRTGKGRNVPTSAGHAGHPGTPGPRYAPRPAPRSCRPRRACSRPGCPRPGYTPRSAAGSCAKLNRSSNRRPGSATAQR